MIRYKKKAGRRKFFVTIFLLLLLIFFSHRNPQTSVLPSGIINMFVSPINRVFYSLSVGLRELYDRSLGDESDRAKLSKLELENHGLKSELMNMRMVVEEKEYLKNEYELLSKKEDKLIPANVSMKDPALQFVRFTINKGLKDGVEKGDAVVEGIETAEGNVTKGLVGYVTEVGLNYAKVSSILDQSSNLSVLFSNSGEYGIINNRDAEGFYGYLLDAQKEISLDEMVVSSGIGGRYPRGLLIGTVAETELSDDGLTKKFSIKPAVSFTNLYRLLVIPGSGAASLDRQEEVKSGGDNE